MESIGEKIKAKREREDISAEKLARILKVSKENIYKWERGSKPSDPEVYARVMSWLNSSENGINAGTNTAATDNRPTWEEVLRRADDHAATLKEIILATLQGMDRKLNGINSNLETVLAGVFQNSVKMEATTQTALRSLARVEGKREDALVKEAGKIQLEKLKESLRQGKSEQVNS